MHDHYENISTYGRIESLISSTLDGSALGTDPEITSYALGHEGQWARKLQPYGLISPDQNKSLSTAFTKLVPNTSDQGDVLPQQKIPPRLSESALDTGSNQDR